jgi:hypothetical protein
MRGVISRRKDTMTAKIIARRDVMSVKNSGRKTVTAEEITGRTAGITRKTGARIVGNIKRTGAMIIAIIGKMYVRKGGTEGKRRISNIQLRMMNVEEKNELTCHSALDAESRVFMCEHMFLNSRFRGNDRFSSTLDIRCLEVNNDFNQQS